MENLLESFTASFSVSSEPNDTSAPHPRLAQYKSKANVPDQSVRRQRMLEEQKRQRQDFVNFSRKLVGGSLDQDEVLGAEQECEEMETATVYKKRNRKRKFNMYAYQLMLSEWLVDIPEDLAQEWLLVICPMGKRNLVIAANGSTAVYTKSGFLVNRFSSLLPGGSPQTLKPGDYTILDCVFSEVQDTFFILDVMCWRGHPVYDSETEFRFYWLQTKLQEDASLGKVSPGNPYKFVGLDNFSCSNDAIQQAISTPVSFQIDGLLFYHKRTHYSPGRTPLVGWLKDYMLPVILGIPVPPEVTMKAPPVNKLTLIEANKSIREKAMLDKENNEKLTTEESEDMEVSAKAKKNNRRRRRKGNKSAASEAQDGAEESVEKMEVSGGKTRHRGKRGKNRACAMDAEESIEDARPDGMVGDVKESAN